MNTQYKTLIDLVKVFPDEKSCHQYLASQRWDTGEIACPHKGCGHDHYYVFADGIRYKCKKCNLLFTAKTDTFMEGSKLSTIKWLLAMYLVMHKKGISSVQLGKDVGVTQKTAWFMLQRIRWAFGKDTEDEELSGTIEIDESFVGGKNKNRHHDKKVKNSQGRAYKDKTPVFGMLERGGTLKAKVVDSVTSYHLCKEVKKAVARGSVIMADEWRSYNPLQEHYELQQVEHGKGQYVNGDCYTNGIENFWSHMKRGIIGVYHKTSRKHLDKYVQEFVFKYNYRNVGIQEQIEGIISNMVCRLKYKDLIS